MVLPGLAELWIAKSSLFWLFGYRRTARKRRNLEAVWGRFGQESRSFGQSGATGARYASRAKPHKHCLYRIVLSWQGGTYFSWLDRCPVPAEAAGSSPVVPAIL